MDAKQLKSKLSVDDILLIMSSLGAEPYQQNDKQIIFNSICHMSESHKLYYFTATQSFYCFSRCNCAYDIFSLIQKVKNIDFISSINYVCTTLHIDNQQSYVLHHIDDWQSMKRFLPNSNYVEPLKIYDKNVLKLFKPQYHQSWIEDGISITAMQKFDIGWYARRKQITIPVYNDCGELVGIHARNTDQYLVDNGLKYQPVKTLCGDEYKFNTSQVIYGLYQNKQNIIDAQEAILCEAPKSVLQAEDILDSNIALGMFGWNFQSRRRDMLLDLGIKKINIALDKQYESRNSEDFNIWVKQVKKIIKLFKPYCDVYIIWDKSNLLQYKDSPFDKGRVTWEKLYNNKTKEG